MLTLARTAMLVQQVQDGDGEARKELLTHASHRLEIQAHRMLRSFPVVRRYEQTGDILQLVLCRLVRALESVPLESVSDFYKLATRHMRWQLISLARHYTGPEGEATNHETDNHDPEKGILAREPARSGEPCSIAGWRELHEVIDKLPEQERTIIDLLFYQGLTQEEAARHLNVDERTIRRWLAAARCRLDERFPQGSGGARG